MSTQREYLIALSASSINHIWVKAVSEDQACERAEELWREDDTGFIAKGGDIDCVTVLKSREVRS